MALDIFINEEMRASHDGKLRDVITAIGNIKDHIRDQRTNRSTSDKNFSSQTLNGNGKHKQEVENVHPLPPIGHVFISYSIQNTKQAMQLKELLNQREIPVWIDKDTDRGNSIEAMVLGLNDARLVIMCLSDGYRQSESCKREAEYTVLKKKLFQPVIFQEGFRMEADWLCFVVGLQSWIDLSSEIQFQANKEMFVEQVQHMFHFGESVRITASVSATASSVVNSRIPFQLSLVDRPYKRRNEITMSPIDSPVIKAPKTDHSEAQDSIAAHVMNWNTDQVINWLDAEGLNNLKEKYA